MDDGVPTIDQGPLAVANDHPVHLSRDLAQTLTERIVDRRQRLTSLDLIAEGDVEVKHAASRCPQPLCLEGKPEGGG